MFKKYLALFISCLPGKYLRVILYRTLFRYEIHSSVSIGWLVWISVNSFHAPKGVKIGRNTCFIGPIDVHLGRGVSIGRWNRFECPDIAASAEKAEVGYKRRLLIGDDCVIHESHYFDVYGQINIGVGTWIAGRGGQMWTHGASVVDRDIVIGNRCYVGSATLFAPGAIVGDRVIIGMGSVVVGKTYVGDQIIGGVPARHISFRSVDNDKFCFERWDP
jgi:acetyltransferase-like isoleucine patch superfamily enzyme